MRPVFLFPCATILDCGASRTSMAVIRGGRTGKLTLERFAVVPHGVELGLEGAWLARTADALLALRARVTPAGPVTVVLPPHLTLMKMLNTPRVAAAKREKIINFEGQQSIPYPLSEVVWDRQISGENSHSFNVLLCAAKLDVLDPLSAAVVAAGMVPAVLLPAARALAASYQEAQPALAPVPATLLVAIGARSTTLVLLEKDAFQARSFAMGGVGVTQHLAESRACDLAHAEEFKLDRAHAEEIAPSIRSFANRLGQEISRTLGYFQRPITPENPGRVLLTGGGSGLPGLAGILAAQLQIPVALFDAVAELELGREAGQFRREEHGAKMAEIIGGAALQLRAAQTSLNLLPAHLREQAGRRRLRPLLAVAAGLAVAAVTPALVHYRRALVAAHEQQVALERELAPLRAAEARDQEQRRRLAEAQRRREAWQKIADTRAAWWSLLGELQTKFDEAGNVWLERMQVLPAQVGNGPAKTGVGPPLRIGFSGLLRPAAGSDPNAGAENYQRVRSLLEQIASAPPIAGVERERFEPAAGGLLRFEFVVVLKEAASR